MGENFETDKHQQNVLKQLQATMLCNFGLSKMKVDKCERNVLKSLVSSPKSHCDIPTTDLN